MNKKERIPSHLLWDWVINSCLGSEESTAAQRSIETRTKVSSSVQIAEGRTLKKMKVVLWVYRNWRSQSPAPHCGDPRSIRATPCQIYGEYSGSWRGSTSCEIFGGYSGSWRGSYPSTSNSLGSIIPPKLQIHLHLDTALIGRTSGRSPVSDIG